MVLVELCLVGGACGRQEGASWQGATRGGGGVEDGNWGSGAGAGNPDCAGYVCVVVLVVDFDSGLGRLGCNCTFWVAACLWLKLSGAWVLGPCLVRCQYYTANAPASHTAILHS
jgi:hypothetical protein